MEQKNTLWILAAAGAFLLVVLGAACIMFSNSKTPVPVMANVAPVEKRTTDTGWIAPPQTQNAASSPIEYNHSPVTTDEVVVYTGSTTINTPQSVQAPQTETTIDLNALKNELYAGQNAPNQNINITVNVPESTGNSSEKVSAPAVASYESSSANAKTKSASSAKENAKRENSGTKTVASVQTSGTNVTVKSNSSKTTAAVSTGKVQEEKKVTQYWVQVAAYSNKKGAENARSVLDANKIQSDIFTYKDNKDKLFYRVRVGPYTTKSEAEYWKSRILKISEFAKSESYVTSTTN